MRRAPIPPSQSTRNRLAARPDQLLARALADRIAGALSRALVPVPAGEYVPLALDRAPEPIAPAVLAAAHPPACRATMQATYASCLAHYRNAASGERDNVGAAMADFVAANLQALDQNVASRAALAPVERQLAAWLEKDPTWVRADPADRQCLFEKFAILAVFVASCTAQARREGPPAVAHVRAAARGYLREFLGVDPARVAIGPQGLKFA